MKISNLLCKVGIHKWFNIYVSYYWSRTCAKCGKIESESFNRRESDIKEEYYKN